MKYRLVKRARGWNIQQFTWPPVIPGCNDRIKGEWLNIASWRWHWVAALHLLWLRERARKK